MPVDTNKLTQDLMRARAAAVAATKGMADGGTCCFDHPVLKVPKTPKNLDAIRAAGFTPGDGIGIYRGYVSLDGFPGSHAQGSPRTKGAEVVSKILNECGWKASVYYQMD